MWDLLRPTKQIIEIDDVAFSYYFSSLTFSTFLIQKIVVFIKPSIPDGYCMKE